MPVYDPRVLHLLSRVLPTFDSAVRNSAPCDRSTRQIYRSTIVCLERKRLGELFDYCMVHDTSVCPATLSAVQIDDNTLLLGGWILLGFMEEWLRDPRNTPDEVVPRPMVPHGAPGRRMIVPMKVIVETLVYTLAQDAYPPMVLPLVWDLYNGEIELSFDQPIAMQVIGAYNKYKKNRFRKLATFELFDVKLGKFRPASVHRAPGSTSFRLPLPLTYIPVFKDSTLTIVEDAAEHSLGIQPLKPMCSMKRNIMDLEFLWPVDMPQRRQLIRADWHVEGQWWGSQRRLAAVRPVLGEVGCTVEEVKWDGEEDVELLSDCRSDLAPFSQDIRKCVDVEFELVGLSCVRQIWNTDWTYQTARQGRSSFPPLAAQIQQFSGFI
ncbi:uncharacterized protein B0H18DRAFT_958755 [Fomitopsis serialis]|uniref:uncharacterized protein n=1 Tax=Fomitopsis serialis TaxID=139415 RepID=UPI002007FD63|nr:uncharacterized protein B0H18DRAFT_958755 [Neoantrodia serialis]KAH9916700.1 hypothetical protein B0H18DRAFT_958755 [Neoantrodia serialis]